MGLRDRALQLLAKGIGRVPMSTSSWAIPPNWATEQYLKMYGNLGWLFGTVSRIASAVADAKWSLYTQRNGQRERVDDHVLLDLLHFVNPFQTGQELMELSQMYLDLVGECFWYLASNGVGKPAEIWVIPPQRMKVVPSQREFIAGWVYEMGTIRIPLDTKEIIQIKYPNPNDLYRGISPAQSITVDLQSELYASRWNRDFFYNDASPGTVLSYPEQITDAEYERLKEQWRGKHGGMGNAHKTAIISGSAKIEKTMISQRDMDFGELRRINRDVILAAYGVPYAILGGSESVNRANAEAAEFTFARWVVRPRLVRIREKLNEQLANRYDSNLELDFADPVPENKDMQLKEATDGVKTGFLMIDEARHLMGYNSLPDGAGQVLLTPKPGGAPPAEGGKALKVLPRPKASALVSEAAKESYWHECAEKSERRERSMVATLRRLFAKQKKEALTNLDDGAGLEVSLVNASAFKEAYMKEMLRPSSAVLLEAIDDGMRLVAPERPKQSPEFVLSAAALRWMKTRMLWAATEVGEETAKLLANELALGFGAGESISAIAGRVENVFKFNNDVRATRIARTEVITASNWGAEEGYRETGLVETIEWFAALDERLCPICDDLHGEEFSLNAGYRPPAHVNCRCIILPVVE